MNNIGDRTLVVLCTFNEAENVRVLVDQLHCVLPQADILVVDDNSPDGTGDWVRHAGQDDTQLFLIARSGKLGLGSATREAIGWCLSRDYDYMIQMDADRSHRASDAPALLASCVAPACDVAVGTRYASGGSFQNIPIHRRLMSKALNRYAAWMLRLPTTDCSGSFRCYKTQSLRKLDLSKLTCNGYGFLEEIIVHLHRLGCRLKDVPITFEPRARGQSKLNMREALGAIRVITQLSSRR